MMSNNTSDIARESVVRIIKTSFHNAWKVFSILPNSIWHESGETVIFSTGINDSLLNGVLNFNSSSNELKSQIRDTLEFFGTLPFSWYVTPSSDPPNLGNYLVDSGLLLVERIIGMAANLKALDVNLMVNNNVDVSLVKSESELADWIDTFSKGFEVSEEFRKAITNVYGKIDYESHFLGTIDDKPVATATLSVNNNVASIYDVSTLPEFRKQGIGTTMTLNALRKARMHDIELVVLQSSEMAVGVYQKLGFVKYCDFQRYASTLE